MLRFIKDFFIYGFASVLGKIAAVLLMPVYTSILTKEEYGAMSLIIACKGIVDLVSNLNIHSGIARDYYEEGVNRKRLISTGFVSILSLSLTILAAMFVTRRFWCESVLGMEEKYLAAFTVMLMTIPAGSLYSYFSILTRYKKKPVLYSIGTMTQLLIQISISIIGVVVLRAGIVSVFVGIFIGEIAAIMFFSWLNREYIGFEFDSRALRKALIFCLPTLPAILAGWVDGSLGRVIIGKSISMSELGVYSVAGSLTSVFTLMGTAFHNVWSPFLYENYKKESFVREIRRLFMVFGLALLCISVLISLFSKELVLLLSNEGYLNATCYLPLLCIQACFHVLFPMASSGISITRDTKYLGIVYVIGSVCNITLLFSTISFLGILAVPICLSVSRIVVYFSLYKISEKKISYSLPNFILIIFIFAMTGCYFIAVLELPLEIRFTIALAAMIGVLVFIQKKYGFDTLRIYLVKKKNRK